MPGKQYKEARICDCGYTTIESSNWSTHKRRCKLLPSGDKERIASLEKQLEDTKRDAKEQLAAKDEQIRELIQVAKKPRTVNHTTNNRYVVEQHINVFGKESLEHIRPEQIESLLADPANAVSRYIKLKHQKAPGAVNANVRVPNQKRAIYQVVVGAAGLEGEEEKEWENRAKGEVLEQMYDENSTHLEAEADEETRVGSQFLEHQDLVKASAAADAEDGGRRYKEQLDKIHMVLAN
jgi:hypothetical protein